ncbi:MAG: acyl-CoA thioesterase, partial [Clostridia bacterium]|nr:acyl-CoA thioesterase [Clostridia bacterium]
MEAYRHTVQYYETDMMGIVHHSNHVKWMEEARVDFLKNIGWEYRKLEELGVFSPVLEISCKYKNPARFGDEINVDVAVTDFIGDGVKRQKLP